MPRKKRDLKTLNVNLTRTVYEDLERFCAETGLNKTAATERMLSKCLEEYFEKSEDERRIL